MTEAQRATGSSTEAQRAERVFMDQDGTRWRVYEQPFADYDRRKGMSLIFSSDGAVRRVRNYPADWMDIPTGELEQLSWRA